ncbi:hypothetical protein LCGC14_1731820 [marine sediment metagenome]|uniref:Uncharacterized protein n=1 Tax=marine sediment metagenome TaxID=412755 RepID=A0A0F9HX17_9ZZZZ
MADTIAERDCRQRRIHIPDCIVRKSLQIPEDAEIVSVRHNATWVEVVLESAEYPIVLKGGVVPVVSAQSDKDDCLSAVIPEAKR